MEIRAEITGEVVMQSDVPRSFLLAVRKELTFPNPAYVTLKKLGKYHRHLPKTIQALVEDGLEIRIPRGYGKRLHDMAIGMGIQMAWRDHRVVAEVKYPAALMGVTLREYQQRAVDQAVVETQGVVVSPTGSGKTMTALEIIRRQGQRAVVLVHNRELLRQWCKEVKNRLGVESGQIGDGQWSLGSHITVAMIQTLAARPDRAREDAGKIGLVLADECHHIVASSFTAVMGFFPAKYRYGFTATPDRKDGLGVMIHRILGDQVAVVESTEVLSVGGIVPARVEVLNTGITCPGVDPDKHGWSDFISELAADQVRNRMVADVVRRMEGTRKVLVLTERVEHAVALAELIPGGLLIHGQMAKAMRQDAMGKIGAVDITIGTKGLLGEGLDCSVWSCLVMATPMSGETPLRQAVGRVIRPGPGKVDGVVVDLVDGHPFALGAWRKRQAVYRKSQWAVAPMDLDARLPGLDPTTPKRVTGKTLLALDLGQNTGWALLQPDGTITSGVMVFKPGRFEGGGMQFLRFKGWLHEIIGLAHGLEGIWFEEVRAHAGTTAAHVYGGFLGALTAWAEENKLPYLGVPVGTIKLHATGRGNAGKDAVIEAMRERGFTPRDDNEADALAILHVVMEGGR